jgi:hypothetical protein
MLRFARLTLFISITVGASIVLAQTALAGGVVTDCSNETDLTNRLAGGGTVTFNCAAPVPPILLQSTKTIAQDTTIDGGRTITLTAGLARRLFIVTDGVTFTVRNIVLDSGFAPGGDGGAIANIGTLIVENSTVQFSQTGPTHGGGAIFSGGTLIVDNSIFNKNNAGNGGAIYLNSLVPTTAQIISSTFTSNEATSTAPFDGGGAIMVGSHADVTVADGLIVVNKAQNGGGLYVSQGSTATLRTQNAANTLVVAANTVADSGGGIYNGGGGLIVKGVVVAANRAPTGTLAFGYGGGIFNQGSLSLSDSFVVGNQGRFGGGLFVGNSATGARADVQHTLFAANTVEEYGGGLYTNSDNTVITVTKGVFDQNSARVGAGIARHNAHLEVSDSSFTSNTARRAGGGLAVMSGGGLADPTLVRVTSSTFDGNSANLFGGDYFGGGIYNQGYSILQNLTIVSNTLGIYSSEPFVVTHLGNSVLDNPGSVNCFGSIPGPPPITSDGYNVSTGGSCALTGVGDRNGVAAVLLGPLTTNFTSYRVPLPGSPLIDAIPPSVPCPPRDQRGALRVGNCDVGAVEFGGLLPRARLPAVMR